MRPILVELRPLPLWAFIAGTGLLFIILAAVTIRDARRNQVSSAGTLVAYAIIYAGLVVLLLRYREILLQPIPIRSYGTMLMLAFIAGIAWSSREAKRRGVDPAHILDLSFFLIIFSILLARGLYVALEWGSYRGMPGDVYRVWQGGLSFHGGLLGAIGTSAVFARIRKLSFRQIADILAPGAALGYGIARIGCFLNGCCYGLPSNLPWAVRFVAQEIPRHPTQIYAALASFAIFGILLLWQKRDPRRGQLMIAYLGLYSIYRFGIEFLRRDASARLMFSGLTEAQVASVIILLVSVAGYMAVSRLVNKQTDVSSETQINSEERYHQ